MTKKLIPGPDPHDRTPDTRQRLTRATRFFAYLETFTLECPHCGMVYVVWKKKRTPAWDPNTSRFWCCHHNGCRYKYVLGIVAWPLAAAPSAASQPPDDQIPHPRQLAQLRREGGGWWLAQEAKIGDARPMETNLTTEEDRPPLDEDEED